MITLIIVNCQNDFITGTISVKGAKLVVEEIKKFIKDKKKEIEKIIFTVDWHPYNHCSFKRYGGELVNHCVQFTPGACIEPKLLKCVQSLEIPYDVSIKGEDLYRDQKGAFEDIDFVQDDSLISKYYFDSIATADADTDFVICGINEDNCIKNTIQNMLNEELIPKIFIKGITSIDNNFIKENKLEII